MYIQQTYKFPLRANGCLGGVKNLLGKKLLTIKEQTDRVQEIYKYSSNLKTPNQVRRVDTPKCPPLVYTN